MRTPTMQTSRFSQQSHAPHAFVFSAFSPVGHRSYGDTDPKLEVGKRYPAERIGIRRL